MAKKTDFKNPALDYLTVPGEKHSTKRTVKSDIQNSGTLCTAYDVTPTTLLLDKEERKTKSVQLRLRPSTYERLRTTARHNQMSVNAAIDRIIENFLDRAGVPAP